jgi:hypothetical protein
MKKTVEIHVEYKRLYVSLQRAFLTCDMDNKYLLQFTWYVLCSTYLVVSTCEDRRLA